MSQNQLHPKIKELKLRALPFMRSEMFIDKDGNLVDSKAKITDDRFIEGYACVWGVRDTYGTGWIKGCFAKSIRDRGPQSTAKQKIVGLWQHKTDDPIGRVVELEEDDYGLRFKIECDDVPSAERALRQIRSGTINGFSFGFLYVWDMMEYDQETDTIWVREAILQEISPVTFASIKETYAIRSVEDYERAKELLDQDTEDILKSIPRSSQLEIRQLITRHISLAKVEPLELRQEALDKDEPKEETGTVDFLSLNKLF